MKKYLLIITGILFSLCVSAQYVKYNIQDAGVSKEGYVVKANYDTLKGYIYVNEPHYMEYSIDYQKNSSSGNSIFRPSDLISYVTKGAIGREVLWVSTQYSGLEHPPEESYAGKMEDAFLNAVVIGPISIYTYYNYKEGGNPERTTTQYMQLPDKSVIDISGLLLGFAKKMPDYVADYEDLANKISKKEKGYKLGNLNDIAREYNSWYIENHPEYKFISVEIPEKSDLKLSDQIVFNSDAITFAEYPDLMFWLSEPYQMYNKWDTQKTGDSWLAVALKMKNNSMKAIAKLTPGITSYNKDGTIMKQSTGGFSTVAFDPNPGNVFPTGYEGVMGSFFTADLADADNFKEVKFTINELGYESSMAVDKPVFSNDWTEFEGYKGLKFKLSEPFIFVDDLSGNNRFGVALEFKNDSGKEIDMFYFQIKVYDDQGLLFDEERQNHQAMYEPSIMKMNPSFPADYQGINKKFYTNEENFINKFKKIEFNLNRVEYK